MNLFIIGDVHGCYHTFLKLLEQWNSRKEHLIQVGDLIDRGNFSPSTIRLVQEIKATFGNQSIFLRGNHEQLMIDYLRGIDTHNTWEFNGGHETLMQFEEEKTDPLVYLEWLEDLPFFWENSHVFVSHAGVSAQVKSLYNSRESNGLLWNRKPLQNIGKLQVIGHTPRMDGKPEYTAASNSWNIDTGAYRGVCLTGVKLDDKGFFLESLSVPTDERDIDFGSLL